MNESDVLAASNRAQEMVRRGRFATKIAIVFILIVGIAVPWLAGLPTVAFVGCANLALLLMSLRFTEAQAGAYAICLQTVYVFALGGLAYSIFGLGVNPDISVYFPPIVVLGCAYILGWRHAVFWSIPCLAIMAAAVYLPPSGPHIADRDLDFASRVGALLTVLAFAVSFRRAHDRQAAELVHLAGTDPLTGLSNRLTLRSAIEEALARSERFRRRAALVFIDLDDMKSVNDGYGHDTGDAYLREIAARIRRISRSYDTLARLGGDEFVILLSETTDPAGVRAYAEKLKHALTEPLVLDQLTIQPRASIGYACYPEDGECASDLLSAADMAMYAAKQAGGNRIAWH